MAVDRDSHTIRTMGEYQVNNIILCVNCFDNIHTNADNKHHAKINIMLG